MSEFECATVRKEGFCIAKLGQRRIIKNDSGLLNLGVIVVS